MLGLLNKKKKSVFVGAYWTNQGTWDLKHFKVGANSEAEAREILTKEKDFRFVCVIKEELDESKREYSELYLQASKEVNRDVLALALMIFCGLFIGLCFTTLDPRISL